MILVTLLSGCGGSASSSLKPKVIITWPSLTREVKAPPYAGSAEISLTFGSSTTPSHWFVDRPNSAAAQTVGYECPDKGPSGPALLVMRFYSKAGGAGTEVATAAVSIKIGEDGTFLNSAGGPLDPVTYSSNMVGFQVNRTSIGIDETQPLIITGFANNTFVAIPQSIVTLAVVENPENATLADNMLTGVQEGPVKIQVSFEEISAPVQMIVTPKIASYHKVSFAANQIAWDPIHGKIWGSFGPSGQYPNSIVDIDPLTGTIGHPILVGSNPGKIGISADGSTAYVGLNGASSVIKVNLNSRTTDTITSLTFFSGGVTITGLDVNPSDPNEFAVCVHDIGDSGFGGPLVFRNGMQVGDTPGVYTASKVKYTSASTAFGIQEDISSGSIFSIGITDTTVDFLQTFNSNGFLSGDISIVGSKAVLGSGMTIDTSSLETLAFLTHGSEIPIGSATDSTNEMAWLALQTSFQDSSVHIRSFDLSSYTSINAVDLPLGPINSEHFVQMSRFGNKGLAVLTNLSLYIIPTAPSL